MGGQRGRLISISDRIKAVELINEARANGARLELACQILNISTRTYQRWTQEDDIKQDQRPLVKRPTPKNKITDEERKKILNTANSREFTSLPPSQIIPKLADQGIYIASESTFYRVLREEGMQNHRGRFNKPMSRPISTHIAHNPNEVWTWDITWLHRDIRGLYFKLYMILDIYSRKIVASEVWEEENSKHAETLVKKALLSEGIAGRPLVLHSDNGSPMKASTFLATLEKLGVQSSFSRPRVSNDNGYSESLFKTLKYVPVYPEQGFTSIKEAREWVHKFVYWYNHVHYHSGLNFISTVQRHNRLCKAIIKKE